MSRTTGHRSKKFTPGEDLAPHVDAGWVQDFTLELTLRGVAGTDTGAALAEVESHCAESGEHVEEAFGPARAYAASLDLPASADEQTRSLFRAVMPTLGQLLGMMLMIWAAPGLGTGQPATVSAGMLVILLLTTLLVMMVHWKSVATVAFVARRKVASILLSMLYLALLALVAFLLQEPAVGLPPLMLLLTGVAVLATATVVAYRHFRTSSEIDDVLTTPLEDQQEVSRRRRTLRKAAYAPIFIVPVTAVAFTAVISLSGVIW